VGEFAARVLGFFLRSKVNNAKLHYNGM